MTRPRDDVVIEFAASISWDPVVVLLGIQQVDPAKMTRKYLRAFRKGDATAAERLAWALQAQALLVRLREDPRRAGYPVQLLMRSLFRLAEMSGFPSPEAFAAIHNVIAPRLRGTAYGVSWPLHPDGWRSIVAPDEEPTVYRKIRKDLYDPATTNAEPSPG